MAGGKRETAGRRTDGDEDRTSLANERTFAGWPRTGMASVAVALGLTAVFCAFEPTWIAKFVATLFLAAALWIFWSSRREALRTRARLEVNDVDRQGGWRITALAVVIGLATISTGAVPWAL